MVPKPSLTDNHREHGPNTSSIGRSDSRVVVETSRRGTRDGPRHPVRRPLSDSMRWHRAWWRSSTEPVRKRRIRLKVWASTLRWRAAFPPGSPRLDQVLLASYPADQWKVVVGFAVGRTIITPGGGLVLGLTLSRYNKTRRRSILTPTVVVK